MFDKNQEFPPANLMAVEIHRLMLANTEDGKRAVNYYLSQFGGVETDWQPEALVVKYTTNNVSVTHEFEL